MNLLPIGWRAVLFARLFGSSLPRMPMPTRKVSRVARSSSYLASLPATRVARVGPLDKGLIMSRKHFVEIARILKVTGASELTCKEMATYMRELSPNFDRQRFMAACGY